MATARPLRAELAVTALTTVTALIAVTALTGAAARPRGNGYGPPDDDRPATALRPEKSFRPRPARRSWCRPAGAGAPVRPGRVAPGRIPTTTACPAGAPRSSGDGVSPARGCRASRCPASGCPAARSLASRSGPRAAAAESAHSPAASWPDTVPAAGCPGRPPRRAARSSRGPIRRWPWTTAGRTPRQRCVRRRRPSAAPSGALARVRRPGSAWPDSGPPAAWPTETSACGAGVVGQRPVRQAARQWVAWPGEPGGWPGADDSLEPLPSDEPHHGGAPRAGDGRAVPAPLAAPRSPRTSRPLVARLPGGTWGRLVSAGVVVVGLAAVYGVATVTSPGHGREQHPARPRARVSVSSAIRACAAPGSRPGRPPAA